MNWRSTRSVAAAVLLLSLTPADILAQPELGTVNVLTRSYGNQRTGANLSETVLNTSNVNPGQFGKLFQLPVDDQVFAGLLYASDVPLPGGTRNVVYVATVNNTVYAFDADRFGPPLWQRNFNGSGRPSRATEVGQACGTYRDFSNNIGIVGTPVIDGDTLTMYLVTRTVEGSGTVQRLRALDITTGDERSGSPRTIQASLPGSGEGSSAGRVNFDPVRNNQRPALALSQGVVYIGWSSFCDTRPFHGWLLAYDASNLSQVGAFTPTPNGDRGGIWMSGGAVAFDAAGDLYAGIGNGSWNGTGEFGESLVKLSPRTLQRLDWFTPANWTMLNADDLDFGSGLPMFLPGTNLLVSGDKQGRIFLFDANNLGNLASGDTQIPHKFQAVSTAARPTGTHNIHNGMATWNGPGGVHLYVWGENDFLRAFHLNTGTRRFDLPSARTGSVLPPLGMPGGMLSISADQSRAGTGIVWGTVPRAGDANQAVVPGVLHAFNAETLALLWSSTGVGEDTFNFSKGASPVVANGRVYIASLSNVIAVYGLRGGPTATPNLALNRPVTSSAPCNADESAAKAVNGTASGGNTDKWCSLVTGTKFLQVDLGTSANVSQVVVEHAGAGGEDFMLNTRAYTLQVSSDGTNFSTVATATANIQSITTHNISPTAARFVRLNVTTATQGGDGAARIYELQVFGSGGGGNPTEITAHTESLSVAGTSGDLHRVALDSGYVNGQGTILEANAAGDFVSYTVNVPQAGSYSVKVRAKRLNNRGIWQLAVGGSDLGSAFDGFSTATMFTEVDLGRRTLPAGNTTFRFTLTGRNPSSSGFWVALDYIKLTP